MPDSAFACVTGETELLTDAGYAPIATHYVLSDSVKVWNGSEFAESTVKQIGDDEEIVTVWFEDGGKLHCTPHLTFRTIDGDEVFAGAARPGTVLQPFHHPVIELTTDMSVAENVAYASGWATLAGFEDNNRASVFVPDSAGVAVAKRLLSLSVDMRYDADGSGYLVRYEPRTLRAGTAPLRWSLSARLSWLGGVIDAVGDWIEVDGEFFLCFGAPDPDLVQETRLLALESGLSPRVRFTDTMHAFMLPGPDAASLIRGGFSLRHPYKGRDFPVYFRTQVADVTPVAWRAPAYRVEGPAVYNGYFTGK
jgi:hypothetical protein